MPSRKILKVFMGLHGVAARRFYCVDGTKSRNRMRAWQIHSYGDLSELQLSKARVPLVSKPDEVLVKVAASSLNPIDGMVMKGYGKAVSDVFRCYELEFPLTLGRDFAGVVVDKGQGVERFKIGEEVYGALPLHKQGTLCDYIVADKSMICRKPKQLSMKEAASILYAAGTAWSALYITGELGIRNPANTKILVLGASGGVGTLAVQILKSQKAYVVATCNGDAVKLIESLGADKVYDYTDEKCSELITEQGFYDIVLDCAKIGYNNLPQNLKYSKFVTLNSPLLVNTDSYGIFGGFIKSATELLKANLSNCPQGKSIRWGFFAPINSGLEFINKLVEKGEIKAIIHKSYNFEQVPQAFELLQAGHLRGKIVIEH